MAHLFLFFSFIRFALSDIKQRLTNRILIHKNISNAQKIHFNGWIAFEAVIKMKTNADELTG